MKIQIATLILLFVMGNVHGEEFELLTIHAICCDKDRKEDCIQCVDRTRSLEMKAEDSKAACGCKDCPPCKDKAIGWECNPKCGGPEDSKQDGILAKDFCPECNGDFNVVYNKCFCKDSKRTEFQGDGALLTTLNSKRTDYIKKCDEYLNKIHDDGTGLLDASLGSIKDRTNNGVNAQIATAYCIRALLEK